MSCMFLYAAMHTESTGTAAAEVQLKDHSCPDQQDMSAKRYANAIRTHEGCLQREARKLNVTEASCSAQR